MPAPSHAMSIEDAYKAIPKEQTPYDANNSPLNAPDAEYLSAFFITLDYAVALRVELLTAMLNDQFYDMDYFQQAYLGIIQDLQSMPTPHKHYETQRLVLEALREQWAFFEEWHYADYQMKSIYRSYNSQPKVKSSSRKLIMAYNLFLQAYPNESPWNKKAFYNHLCALDFI
tara:strand:+ start:50349 stop:50864 length:516 start_codon:yes stop_codon:yes gene_type:complete